jgi:hypothetical protein
MAKHIRILYPANCHAILYIGCKHFQIVKSLSVLSLRDSENSNELNKKEIGTRRNKWIAKNNAFP